jgi:predicted MFS family arabinose efflux permease
MDRPDRTPHPYAAAALVLAVVLAFADAAVVALALPDLYTEFEASIPEVSWVLVAYALAAAVAGLAAVALLRRVSAVLLTVVGGLLFAAASGAAGYATSLDHLVLARAVQGVGGAALVAGSFAVLGPLLGDSHRAARWWATAGTVGAALGPALGGAVTQLLDWRAVFLFQAPIAVAGVVGCVAARRSAARVELERRRRPAGAFTADLALGLTFGALVGALFLGVLLLVVVWGVPPLAAALVVSTLPLGTLLAPHLARAVTSRSAALAGAALLTGGLTTLALLPALDVAWVAAALGLCGLGFGLLSAAVGVIAVPAGSGLRAATLSSAVRHLGLVLGLVVIAPVLSVDVTAAAQRVPIPATAAMLDAPIGGLDKVRLAFDIRDLMRTVPDGEVPDLDAVFLENGADTDPDMAQLQVDVEDSVKGVITRSFRRSLGVAAVFAAAAGLTALVAVELTRRRPGAHAGHHADAGHAARGASRRGLVVRGVALSTVAAGLALALPVGAMRAGAADFGRIAVTDPCTAPPDPFPGGGFDAAAQRFVLSGLNGAACELGVSREELVLSLDSRSGFDQVQWDRATIEDALRAGVKRSIADADARGTLPGWIAKVLRWTVDRVPLAWFLEQLGVD